MEQIIPTIMYHKEIAPEGRLITSKEEFDALEDDWKDTPAGFDQKPDAATSEETGDQGEGEQGKAPIEEADFAKMTKAQLIAFLVEKGLEEKDLKKLTKDELIAKIGSL